ncbi:peptidase E [Candidatus Woesearchaeota archaeon]|nr:peptidase E [Candidatus Woesearchaeota archaeon]
MKLYLSSYRLGKETDKLIEMTPIKKIAYIPNALDFEGADPKRKQKHIEKDMNSLKELGLQCELLDLKQYFNKEQELKQKLKQIKAVFISGGNTYVLRQAMKLSGMDKILNNIKENKENFLYAGYSAAGCVLSPSLKVYQTVDNPQTPYKEQKEIIWEGLGFIDYAFMPHYDSDHNESEDINKEIEYCKTNSKPYKAIRDGEVIIEEK